MENRILDVIRKILESHFLIRVGYLNPRAELSRDLGMNSYELMEMLLYVEDQFHIEVKNDEAVKIKTVGDLVYCVQRNAN